MTRKLLFAFLQRKPFLCLQFSFSCFVMRSVDKTIRLKVQKLAMTPPPFHPRSEERRRFLQAITSTKLISILPHFPENRLDYIFWLNLLFPRGRELDPFCKRIGINVCKSVSMNSLLHGLLASFMRAGEKYSRNIVRGLSQFLIPTDSFIIPRNFSLEYS